MSIKRTFVLGYPVDIIGFNEALEKVLSSENFMQIITINPEMIQTAKNNPDFDTLLKNADLIVPDGVGIKLALKFQGINQEQIAGCDFAKNVIELAAQRNEGIALIGAKQDVLELTQKKLKEEYPNLKIQFAQNGYFKEEEQDRIIKEIQKSGAKYLFAALGSPKQEFFIKKCKEQGCNVKAIGVGGSFDVWSGLTQRAPKIWQKMGLEWLYRTIKQPERFKRIFPTLPLFLFRVIITGKSEREKQI